MKPPIPLKSQKTPKNGDEIEPPKEVVETVDANWGEGLEEKEFVLQGEPDEPCDDPKKVPDGDDDDEYKPSIAGDEIVADLSKEPKNVPVDAGDEPLDPEAQLHKEVEQLSAPLKVRHVTLMEPVMSRGVQHVLPAMDRIMTRMKYMGVWVNRIHSDRAKELLSSKFRSWVAHQNVMQSFTAGDDPQSNGHCEAEVNQLKRRTRLLLHTASQENTHWPQAMRYAVEERLRGQMNALGSPTPKMLPYNSNVLVKRKRWHNRRDLMPRPFVEAKLLCPSPDMTNGWLVFTTKERQVLHASEAILPDPVGDQVHLQLEEAEAGSKPPRRLHGKQPMPGHQPMRVPLPEMPRDDRGGEPSLVFDGFDGSKGCEKRVEHVHENPEGEKDEIDRCFDELMAKKCEKKLDSTTNAKGILKPENLKMMMGNTKNGLWSKRKPWIPLKSSWDGCMKMRLILFMICWMLSPQMNIWETFVGHESTGCKRKGNGWNRIS